jgi:hypothetical protein
MKIFVSWSGKKSHEIATIIRDWMSTIFPGIELFVSSEDIRKGKRWPLEVSNQLGASNFGIVCLTRDNLSAPWLLFESGALSKSIQESSVYTLLADGLHPSDIEGPLSHFQHTTFEKQDFLKLVTSINGAQKEGKQEANRLGRVFEKFWDELDSSIKTIQAEESIAQVNKTRSVEDMLREVLDITRLIAKNLDRPALPPISWPALMNPNVPPQLAEDWAKLTHTVMNRYAEEIIRAPRYFHGNLVSWELHRFLEQAGVNTIAQLREFIQQGPTNSKIIIGEEMWKEASSLLYRLDNLQTTR